MMMSKMALRTRRNFICQSSAVTVLLQSLNSSLTLCPFVSLYCQFLQTISNLLLFFFLRITLLIQLLLFVFLLLYNLFTRFLLHLLGKTNYQDVEYCQYWESLSLSVSRDCQIIPISFIEGCLTHFFLSPDLVNTFSTEIRHCFPLLVNNIPSFQDMD